MHLFDCLLHLYLDWYICLSAKSNMNNLDKPDHMIMQLREMIELDQLYNFRQGDLFVRNYIAIFEELARHCDVRAPFLDYNQICFRFKI